jgi:hypothetical protein
MKKEKRRTTKEKERRALETMINRSTATTVNDVSRKTEIRNVEKVRCHPLDDGTIREMIRKNAEKNLPCLKTSTKSDVRGHEVSTKSDVHDLEASKRNLGMKEGVQGLSTKSLEMIDDVREALKDVVRVLAASTENLEPMTKKVNVDREGRLRVRQILRQTETDVEIRNLLAHNSFISIFHFNCH